MKKVLSLLLTLMTIVFAVAPTSAQSTLTVANGTETNPSVPFYSYWLDQEQRTQILYPASMLTDMVGHEITRMEFYMNGTPDGLTSQLTISLGISTASEFPTEYFDNTTPLSVVYTGDINVVNNILIIAFNTPFTYTGGNLLFNLTTTAGLWNDIDFYGITQQNASINQYDLQATHGDRFNFLPKTTFTHDTVSDCPKPTALTVSYLTTNSATISWTGSANVPNYSVQYMPASSTDWSTALSVSANTTTANLTNLQINTMYKVRVLSLCSDGSSATSLQTLIFTTLNTPITLPYIQNFETSPQTITDFAFMGGGNNQWKIGPATFKPSNPANTGETGYSMYISNDNGISNHYDVGSSSKAFAILTVNFGSSPAERHLSFDYKTLGELVDDQVYDYFSLYLVDANVEITPNSIPNGIPLLTEQYDVSDWTHVDFPLTNVTGTTKKIVFYWENDAFFGNNPPVAVDNIMITNTSCAQPNILSASGITNHSAVLHWNEMGTSNTWTVYYKALSDAEYTSVPVSGTPSYTVTGLTPDTYYTFYVVSNCDSDVSAPSPTYTFRTLCGALTTLPYIADFDESIIVGGSEYVPCWSRLASNPSHQVYYLGDATYSHNGSAGCLDFAYTPYCWTMAIAPEIAATIPLNTLMLDFYLAKTGESGTFEVGVMTDPTDASTFQLVKIITSTVTGNSAASYEHHVVTLENYTGNGHYIAFRAANAIDCGFRMDDLIISVMPPCMLPINFTCINTTNTSAALSWTETGHAQAWDILYGVTGFNPGTGGTQVSANTNPFSVTNLQGATSYDFYVRSNCGDTQSDWVGPITAKTSVYNMGVTGSDTLLTCDAFIFDDGGEFGVYSSNCDFTLVIVPATEGNGLHITGTVNTFDMFPVSMGILTIYEGVGIDGDILGSYTGIYDVDVYNNGPITLRFVSSDDWGFEQPGFELEVHCISCFPPTDLTVTNFENSQATVTWSGNATLYSVYLDGPTTGHYFTTNNSYTFTNLVGSSGYYVSVRSICGTDSSMLSQPVYISTDCAPITVTASNPWFEDFESYPGVGQQPFVCWDVPVGAGDGGPYVLCGNGQAAHSGTNTAELTGFYNILALPEFTNNVHDLRLSFWATGYGINETSAQIGVITDISDPSTFEMVCNAGTPVPRGSAAGDNGILMGPFDFNGVSATNGRIAIRYTSSYAGGYAGWNMDDFTVSLAPDCPSPVKSSLATTYVAGTSATLTFTDNDTSHHAWVIYYKKLSETTWSTQSTTSTTPVLTGLVPQTTYQAYVVTNCGSIGPNPDATNTIQFTTSMPCPAPVNIVVAAGTNSAVVTWIGSSSSYTVVCAGQVLTVTSPTATLTGLNPATNYTVSVTGDCGDDGVSATGTATFTTACDIVTDFPYTEGFNNNSFDCWTVENLVGNNPWLLTANNPHTGAGCIYKSFTPGSSARIVSPIFDLSGQTNPMLSFYQRRNAWNDVADSLVVFYRTSIANDWVRIIGYYDATNNYRMDSIELPGASATYQIAFVGYGIDGFGICLDDITVYDAGGSTSCSAPTAVTVSNVQSYTAHVSWTAGGSESAWKIQYKKATTANWGAEYSSSNPHYNISGLQPSTPYHVRVKAVCPEGGVSEWTNLVSFTTLSGGSSSDPTVVTEAASAITEDHAILNATITNPDNVTITATGFEWKATNGGTYTQVAGTSTGNTFSANLANLTPNTNYTFKAFITYDNNTVFGEAVTFTTLNQSVVTCDVPTGLHTTNVENHAISIAWDADNNVDSWNIQYRIGENPWSSTTTSSNSYTITDLASLTTYEIQVQADCGNENLSDWSSSITATTTNVGIENWLANSVTLFPNPANEYINVECRMQNVEYSITDIQLFDVYGKMIWTNNHLSTPTRINVSGLADGMYFVRVTTDKGAVTKTFVKK